MAASLYLLKATRHLGRSSDRGSVGEGGRGRWMDGRRSLGLKVRLGKERGDGQEGDLPAYTSRQTDGVCVAKTLVRSAHSLAPFMAFYMPGRWGVCISWLGIITDTLTLPSKSPLMALLRCLSALATLCQLRAAGCYLQGFNGSAVGKVEPVCPHTTTGMLFCLTYASSPPAQKCGRSSR